MGLRPTQADEDAVRKVGVGRRKRLPQVGCQWGRRFRLPTERSRVFNGVGALAVFSHVF
jgi:hypothetical protein